MAGIIAVANQKGGVGKTATTANLGTAIARLGYRVLIVDMDPQGNLTASFGVQDKVDHTIADALLDRNVRLPVVNVRNGQDGGRLDLAPANATLAAAESSLSNKLGREFRLRDVLATTGDQYKLVLIDTPPSLGLLTVNSLVAASRVIVPTEARFFSLQGLQGLEETIAEVQYLNPTLKILGILLSKLDRRLREEQTVANYLREHWGELVFNTEIGTNSKILEAASSGQPVYDVQGGTKAAELYGDLAREVLERG
ncbi:MAG TPA: ParA family protein [Chloroflexota bacterium]|nr:ParA family protein [Chloroflexota bacterium]